MTETYSTEIAPARRPPRDWRVWLATGLGVGFARFAPGTVGSLWGPLLVWGLTALQVTYWWHAPVALVLFLVGVPLCNAGARYFEREDPPGVVWDEIAAFPVIYLLSPFTPLTGLVGFLLFRVFDIAKPWPIRRFEALPGGWGIMADDLVAGVYAMAVLRLLLPVLTGI